MRTQKAIATVIILAGSVLIAAVFRDIAFPAILAMLGLLGLQRRFTWDIRPERRVITSLLLLVLAILFAAHYTYGGALWGGHEQASIVAWETISRYFLASMILILFLGSPQRLPPSLALFYMATVVSAGQVLLLDDLYMPFRLLEAASVILIVLYAAAGQNADVPALATPLSGGPPRLSATLAPIPAVLRSRRWVAPAVILVIAVNLGWIMGSVLYHHVELLNYVPVWLWHGTAGIEAVADNTARVGFSTSGELSSILRIKGEQDTTPALRILSDACPGYLRARAFDIYRSSEWTDVSATRPVMASQNMPFSGSLPGRMNFFRLNDRRPANAHEMMIRHEMPVRDAMFTPLGTLSVEAPLSYVNYDDDSIVSPPYARNSLSYRVTCADLTYAPSPTRPMLGVPPQLDPRIRQLAEKIFTGTTTTAEKIDAVINHFRTRYAYSLSMTIPPERDKLEYFLLDGTTGYCEYFASGAAILLRLGKVPTRYVTGFLVTAKDADGQTWVARNMDAHAWVEAWDHENNHWAIVEATVQDGLASASSDDDSAGPGGLSRYLLLGQLLNDLYDYGLFGVLAWSLQYYGLPAVSLVLATALAAAFAWLYRRTKAARARQAARPLTPEVIALHRLLARVDRTVKAAGARRDSNETIHAFSHRLRTRDSGTNLWTRLSDWYIEYADLRYCRTIPPDRLQHLHALAAGLQQS
jgi:transglutaminase-like putative cysteine protease